MRWWWEYRVVQDRRGEAQSLRRFSIQYVELRGSTIIEVVVEVVVEVVKGELGLSYWQSLGKNGCRAARGSSRFNL